MPGYRPVFFDLAQNAMPNGAITSIMHRTIGALLAFCIPGAVYLLQLSLRDELRHLRVAARPGHFRLQALAAVFIWIFGYHLLASVCHFLSDIDVGSRLRGACFPPGLSMAVQPPLSDVN